MYGEVVDVLPDNRDSFRHTMRAHGKLHWFVSKFGIQNGEPAAVITDRFTIDGQRGIHLHGSNRTGVWRYENGKAIWESRLGGPASGGCGRMAHADIRDLGRYIKLPVWEGKKLLSKGTPIYIHATPAVMQRSVRARSEPTEERRMQREPREVSRGRPEERPRGGFKPPWDQSLN